MREEKKRRVTIEVWTNYKQNKIKPEITEAKRERKRRKAEAGRREIRDVNKEKLDHAAK